MTPGLHRILEAKAKTAPTTSEKITDQHASEAFSDPDSMSGMVSAVERAFRADNPSDYEDGVENWVEEVYEDRILANMSGDVFEITYTRDAAGKVTFGDKTKVKVTLTTSPVTEGVDPDHIRETASGSAILESLDDGAGWIWRVTMVRPGISGNGKRYRPEVLREAITRYEGVKAFDGHRDDATRKASAVGGLVGWHANVTQEPDGALTSDFHIAESAPKLRDLFVTAHKNNRPDLIGFSHDVVAAQEAVIIGGRRLMDVRKIVEVNSVDVVADPSAGGRLERLVASRQKEDSMKLEDFLRALRSGGLTAEQITEAVADHPEWQGLVDAQEAGLLPAESTPPAPTEPAPAPAPVATITETAPAAPLSPTLKGIVIDQAVREANLPKAAIEKVTEALKDVFDEETILARVQETADIWSALAGARPSPLPGQGGVEVGVEEREKFGKALEAMLRNEQKVDDVPAFRSVKEAYSQFTGRTPYGAGDEDFARRILAESMGAVAYSSDRLTESLNSTSWAEALADAMHKALVAEYNRDTYQSWRRIVSEFGNPIDFKSNKRIRVGGYDILPTVAERAPYQNLTSPGDEQATYAVSKKGGLEDYTLEMVANDDVSALRRIPRSLARAAALTLYRAVWNLTIAANATVYDAVALYDAAHNNTTAAALGEAGIESLRTKMMGQTAAGEASGFIGLIPRFLVVPTALYSTAFKLARSAVAVVSGENATTPNPWEGLEVIEVPTFTDADDWHLIADPATVPTIEVGFYQGRQDPELLIQDQPAVGSVFTADVFTWKIRHIWGLTVLDFRGFQRGTQ